MIKKSSIIFGFALSIFATSCTSQSQAKTIHSQVVTKKKHSDSSPSGVKSVQYGKASWYSIRTNFGTKTASGQRLNENAYTAAHKTLPLGSKVRVTNLRNNRSEVLTINDRGPYVKGRIIDVTIGSARRLGFAHGGVAPVKVEVLRR